MTLLLSESDVLEMLSMTDTVQAIERSFIEAGRSGAINSPRTRTIAPGSVLNVMHASLPYLGRSGTKVYASTKEGTNFVFLLFDTSSGNLLSMMGADTLGRYRTGAASAVATKYLSPLGSFRLAIAGSGRQALTQVLAMREVAELEEVSVWSPSADHREVFARRLSREHGIDASAHPTVEEAFRGAQVGTTITNSESPFVGRRAIRTLTHLNACGANWPDKSEVSPEALADFSTICVDDLSQSMAEAGDLILAVKKGKVSWEGVVELKDVIASRVRTEPKSYFKSNGVAIEDVALGSLVFDRALKRGGFREVELRAMS